MGRRSRPPASPIFPTENARAGRRPVAALLAAEEGRRRAADLSDRER